MPSVKSSFRRRPAAGGGQRAGFLSNSLRLAMLTLLSAGGTVNAAEPLREGHREGHREAHREAYREVPMPPGFHVEATELEGPVFANKQGMTLYIWPQHKLRNGYSGEPQGAIECGDEVIRVTAGLMSPYPPGILLPELGTRKSCTDLWPPVIAATGAEPVGEWTLLERDDGRRQWAYEEQALYTSIRDQQPGDTIGGSKRDIDGDAPAGRQPAGPPAALPPGFDVRTTNIGRMLTTDKLYAVYAFDDDRATSSACRDRCLDTRKPLLAPALARSRGEWSILERSPGVRQWVFRGEPLYSYSLDPSPLSQVGSDAPGWHNVFTQTAPAYPSSFSVQNSIAGEVLADREGRTIYLYQCGEDSADQLACDHPADTQVYRLAMCGAGDPERCMEYWPYVRADDHEVSANRSWRILTIDPRSGRRVSAASPAALRVWAYRDRPVYTFAGDKKPGDVNGAGTGEWRGKRNGLFAFWLRDDFMEGIE
jgi:predicted lipoprotein with Yx(FWY)xxD motif